MFTWDESDKQAAKRDEQFRRDLQRATSRAFGLKVWNAGLAPVPWRIRLWRRLTFAYRRGRAIDWRSYNAAEAEARRRDEAYRAALPGRMREIADKLSEGLPDGMRFEWTGNADASVGE